MVFIIDEHGRRRSVASIVTCIMQINQLDNITSQDADERNELDSLFTILDKSGKTREIIKVEDDIIDDNAIDPETKYYQIMPRIRRRKNKDRGKDEEKIY